MHRLPSSTVRVAPRVELSPEERETLVRWSRQGRGRSPLAVRAKVVLRAALGASNLQIGQELRIGRLTAARWRARFLDGRVRAIERFAPRSPGPGRIPEETVQAIVRATGASTRPGARVPSSRQLAARYRVSHTTVCRVWGAYGVRPATERGSPPRADPDLPLVPGEIAGLLLRPPLYALAVRLRPAATRGRAAFPPRSGEAGRRSAVGSTLDHVLRDLRAPEAVGRDPGPEPTELLRFLEQVYRSAGPGVPIRVLITRPRSRDESPLARWLVRHPRFRLRLLIDPVRWKEAVVLDLDDAAVRSLEDATDARSRTDLSRNLGVLLGSYEPRAGSFAWVATARELAEGEAGFRLRYDLSVTAHPGFKRRAALGGPMTNAAGAPPKSREMARLILRKNLGVRRGEHVTIDAWTSTLPYATAFVIESRLLGARPLLLYEDEPAYWAAAAECRPAELAILGEPRRAALEKTDALVSFFGPSDRGRFHALPARTRRRLCDFEDSFYRSVERAGARAVQLAIGRVSAPSARMYGVDEDRWREELVASALVPPAELARRGRSVAARLRSGRRIEIAHPNGTRLMLGLRGLTPEVSDGMVPPPGRKAGWSMPTVPAGVVTVGLDERTAEGVFKSNVDSSVGISDGVGDFSGGRWTFAGGQLTRSTFDRGGPMFDESFEGASAGRERPASISIGLNPRIVDAPLLQDQGLGTVTFNIGRNDHVGGRTRVPWWAWLSLRGSDLRIDGVPLLKTGRLVT